MTEQSPAGSTSTPVKRVLFETLSATVEQNTCVMQGLHEITFHLDKPITFTAGQYVSVFLPEIKHPLPFSIASSPTQHEQITLGIEIVGEGTKLLCGKRVGESVVMKGPFGMFTMGAENNVCFLAGGVGITPFMSMLRWIRDARAQKNATLLYSCKEPHQFMWFEELSKMPEQHPNTKIVFTLTRDAPADWKYKTGRINEQLIRESISDITNTVFYCCGPPVFINAMQQLVISLGAPPANFRREAWHSAST